MKDEDLDLKPVKQFFKTGLRGRGYELKVWLIVVSLIPALALCLIVGLDHGFGNQFYYECDAAYQCANPYHETYLKGANVDITPEVMKPYSDMQYFPRGFSVGVQEPPLMFYAWLLMFVMPGLALVVNHYVYNKNRKVQK